MRIKNDARRCYMKRAEAADLLPHEIANLLIRTPPLLQPGWLAIDVLFTLETPWYSKDDRPFHVLDNPVRKDRVFGVPFMSAASWKGLLRWSCRMEHGLLDYLAKHDGDLDGWSDPPWVAHLFGNAKGEEEDFCRGALQCFPTWFDKVGFEVINPHDRARRAGTQPILYEVVPSGRKATLHLMYAPAPVRADARLVDAVDVLSRFLEATRKLLTVYGFSAKRTAGWGIAEIQSAEVRSKSGSRKGTVDSLKAALHELIHAPGGQTWAL
ncbi:MAG: RAMP superfamily CRISPR-associated protein [Vicinamibacterales bacterium]